jgi:hypothetical protein
MTTRSICDKNAAELATLPDRGRLPFTTLLFLAIGMGAATALAAVHELRLSPRPIVLADSGAAFAAFLLLLLLPVSVYFYVFHGDWFLLYLVDVHRVPSALALLGFFAQIVLGLLSFTLSAVCVRNQHNAWVIGVVVGCVLGGLGVVAVCPNRLKVLGTFREYQGGFGLLPYGGALLQGALAMGGLLTVGAAFLLLRIRRGQTRGGAR